MGEADKLMAEILADPASEAARLVYADHLIELGDPRGELIHLQCAWERLDVDDPQRDVLAQRAQDLIALHETEWTHELRAFGLGDHVQQLAFRRGFVEMVSLSAANVGRLPALRMITPVREVQLTTRDGDRLAPIGELLVEIERLGVFGLGDSGRSVPRAVEVWPFRGRTRALEVPGGADAARAIARSPGLAGLEELKLFAVREGGVQALASAAHLGSLRQLELPQAALPADALVALASAPHLGELRVLDLSSSGVDGAGLATLARGALLPGLLQLRLNGNRIREDGARVLADVATELELLDLDATAIGDAGVTAILGATKLTRLRRLDVSRCQTTSTGVAQALRHVALPSLRHLVAIESDLDFHATRALAAAPLPALQVLDLSNNALSEEAIIALAQSTSLPALHALHLQRTGCGERALAALGASELGARLRRLDLAGNQLDDDAVYELLSADRLDALVRLELGGSRLTRRGVEALVHSPLARRLEYLELAVVSADDLVPLLAAEWPELRMLVANAFDDRAATVLGSAGRLPKLNTLVFSAPELTDHGAIALAQSPLDRVLWMELDAPRLSDAGKAAIRERYAHHAYVFSGALLHAFRALGRRI